MAGNATISAADGVFAISSASTFRKMTSRSRKAGSWSGESLFCRRIVLSRPLSHLSRAICPRFRGLRSYAKALVTDPDSRRRGRLARESVRGNVIIIKNTGP